MATPWLAAARIRSQCGDPRIVVRGEQLGFWFSAARRRVGVQRPRPDVRSKFVNGTGRAPSLVDMAVLEFTIIAPVSARRHRLQCGLLRRVGLLCSMLSAVACADASPARSLGNSQ